jgi:FkbM family methyltransferase
VPTNSSASWALPQQRRRAERRRSNASAGGGDGSRMVGTAGKKDAPCFCETSNPEWHKCERTEPKCLFIDLGAADGNSFNEFVTDKFGPIKNCPSGGAWEAVLVEANPRFTAPLKNLGVGFGNVKAMSETAAYMCEGKTSFFVDTTNHANNYWASSMSSDSDAGQQQKIEVPTVNVMRLLYENAIPSDWVILKMDIEGSEWDIMPCMAQAQSATLIDQFYVEVHPGTWGLTGTDDAEFQAAKARLKRRGVAMPDYFSQTL